jgi:osmotically-inducible protein OsmY
MKTDGELKQHLLAQLEMEPDVNWRNIKVSVENGIVTLKGTVSSYAEKLAAADAAKRPDGVTGLVNNVMVEIPSSRQRTDAEIASAASNVINCITTVPTETIKITARDGWLTLEGTLEHRHEKEAAEDAVHHLTGIIGITNSITIEPTLQTEAGGTCKPAERYAAERAAKSLAT